MEDYKAKNTILKLLLKQKANKMLLL